MIYCGVCANIPHIIFVLSAKGTLVRTALAQRRLIQLIRQPGRHAYDFGVPIERRDVMFSFRFGHNARSRDLGGLSSKMLLAFALVTCLEWSILLHLWK